MRTSCHVCVSVYPNCLTCDSRHLVILRPACGPACGPLVMFVYLCIQIALHVTRDIWSSSGQLVGLLEDLLSCLFICVSKLPRPLFNLGIHLLSCVFLVVLMGNILMKWFCNRPRFSGHVPVYHAPIADWVTSLLRLCCWLYPRPVLLRPPTLSCGRLWDTHCQLSTVGRSVSRSF